MKRRFIAGLVATTGLLLIPSDARSQVVSGDEAKDHVRSLTGDIHWYHSLTQAEEAAGKQEKMIFWVQMLGSLDGTT